MSYPPWVHVTWVWVRVPWMRSRIKMLIPMFGDWIGPWRTWFAWRPVRTYDDVTVWFSRAERRLVQKHEHLVGGRSKWWIYRLPNDWSI